MDDLQIAMALSQADYEADIAATARALGLSERDLRAQQEALEKGFRGQPMHAASLDADSEADIAATARALGLSERDLREQQLAYSGHTAAFESPFSGRAPIPRHQTGDLSVTNASHVYDCKLAKKLLPPGTLPKDQQKALDRLLTLTVNLPVKTRSANFGTYPDSDNVLDAEIMKAIGTRQPLSEKAFARVCAKVALVKGCGKDAGLNDDSIKSLICPLLVLRGPNGTTVDERYPVVYENGKPVNIWKDKLSAETGLKDNGEPDLRTTKGRERDANAKTFAQDTGLTKDFQADERTKLGQHLGVPKAKMLAALTGKKKDGTPDMRTKLGKQIEEARLSKQANVPVVESSSKSDDSLSAQSTPQKKPPAHTPPSPAREAAAKLVERESRAREGQHQREQLEALQRAARAREEQQAAAAAAAAAAADRAARDRQEQRQREQQAAYAAAASSAAAQQALQLQQAQALQQEMAARARAVNPWNAFTHAHSDMGFSMQQLSNMYHTSHGSSSGGSDRSSGGGGGGPRCKDGSLDMRCAANRGMNKYG